MPCNTCQDPGRCDRVGICQTFSLAPFPARGTAAEAAKQATLCARAFDIADDCMYSLIETTCVPHDSPASDATCFGFVDAMCSEVAKLADACPTIREAFDWLKERGYVELGSDGAGEYVQVVRRPGEHS